MCGCMYVPDNLENGWQNILISDLKKSRICPIQGQIWSPWFGKIQIKQQSDLDDALEITPSEKKLKKSKLS